MNKQDVLTAISFLYACDYNYVVLVCRDARTVPYVKRALHQTIGTPRKHYDNELHYGDKYIKIVPATRQEELRGYNVEQCFYVAYEDDSDWRVLVPMANGGVPNTLAPLMVTPWFSISELYVKLWSEYGMSGASAWAVLSNEEVKSI